LGTKFSWDVAVTYDHVVDHKEIHDMLVDRLQDALNGFGGPSCNKSLNTPGANGCQWLNPFSSAIPSNYYSGATNPGYVPALANDPNLIRSLYELMWLERTYEDVTFDPVITGDTGIKLPGGNISMAFGAQFRYRSENTQLDDLNNRTVNPCATIGYTGCTTQAGVFAFARESTVLGAPADILSPFANGHTNRKFPAAAVFIEGEFPILNSLTVSAAGRYEKFYSDITDKDNDVFVPAASIKWQALDWAAVRASAGSTFSQVNPPAQTINPAPITATNATYNVSVGGASYSNVDVKPMKGDYLDLGFIVKAGGFQGTLDWYAIKINDFVRTMTTTNVISALVMPGQIPGPTNQINCASPLLSAAQAALGGRPFVELNGPCVQGSSLLNSNGSALPLLGPVGGLLASGVPVGVIPGRINYFGTTDETNSGALETSGIDLNASYTFDNVFGGILTPSIDATYVLKYHLGDFVINGITVTPGFDGVGFRNTSGTRNGQSVPEYRATFGVNYHNGNHNVNVAVRYLPAVIDDNAALFTETTARNANVGNAAGVVTSAGTCAISGYPTDTNGISTLGATPPGAGTGTNGTSIPTAAGGATGVTGICTFQNNSILTGQKVKAQSIVDMTYRVNLPAETDLSLTIYNLLDQDPAFSRNAINYDAGFGSPLGRNFKLQVAKRF
jgi:iron complex outermembrane receptor protein